jgi:hypothetical protein
MLITPFKACCWQAGGLSHLQLLTSRATFYYYQVCRLCASVCRCHVLCLEVSQCAHLCLGQFKSVVLLFSCYCTHPCTKADLTRTPA